MTADRAILFDLDGTLAETAPDLTHALNHVLTTHGRPALALADVRDLIGHGARALMKRGFAATGDALDEAGIEALMPMFLDYYGQNIANSSYAYPNVAAVLDQLLLAGHGLAVCTNKPEGLSRALLTALGLDRYFPVVIGGDTLPVRKPDPRHLTEAVTRLGASRAVMVGDSDTDLRAGRAAGMPVVLVSFGYSSPPASELDGDALIDDFTELPDILARLPA